MACSGRSIFMPDVQADAAITVTLTNVTTAAVYTLAVSKGDWWASAFAFWADFCATNSAPMPYLIARGDNGLSIAFDTADNMAISFSASGGMFDNEVAGTESTNTWPVPGAWYTQFPVVEFSRGLSVIGGSSAMSGIGTVYTVQGIPQQTRNLRVQFKVDDDFAAGYAADYSTGRFDVPSDLSLWRLLIGSRFVLGRSVSFYLEDSIIGQVPTSFKWGDGGVGRCESLCLEWKDSDSLRAVRPTGIPSEYLSSSSTRVLLDEDERTFYIRRPRNYSAMYTDFGLREMV